MILDPEGPFSLLLRAGGTAWFLLTAVTVILGTPAWIWARLTKRQSVTRLAMRTGIGVVGVYALSWLLGLLVLRGRALAPGEELLFCGLDCHLHLTAVRAVRHDGSIDVTMRARSDAKAVIEDPADVQISLRDDSGQRWFPEQETVIEPLRPGAAYERTLRFGVPPGTTAAVALTANWRGTLGWLVPGPENVLVQRRTQIRLLVETVRQ